MIRVVITDGGDSPSRTVDFNNEDAIEVLRSGNCRLDPLQPEPPFAVLDYLATCMLNIERLGPAANEEDELQWVTQHVFPNGIRQSVVAGSKLIWYESSLLLLRALGHRLCGTAESESGLLEQAKHVMAEYTSRLRVMSPSEYSFRHNQRAQPEGIFTMSSASSRLVSPEPKWQQFSDRLQGLMDQRRAIAVQELATGRILCCEDNNMQSRLIHPELAQLKAGTEKRNYSYAFTGELPKAWLDRFNTLHKRRNHAAKWMFRTFVHFERQGRRATRAQLTDEAMSRYHLTANAAADAWKTAAKDLKVGGGDIPHGVKVESFEIKMIG
jgi:hypothetical protein